MKIEDLKIIEDEINNNKSLIEKINSLENNISSKQKEIKFKELKIQKEQHLSKMPSQAFGSVALYNQLNENYQFFDKDQFNKVVRFISHIEDKEKDYRRLYLKCTKNYMSDPKNIPIDVMKKTKKEIDFSYKLLSILINEVNGDLVSFNKVYNKLEDAGLFMTVPEKRNQEYLNQISDKLSVVMNGLKVIFEQLEHTNDILRSIDDSTSYSASVLDDVSNHLWDISYSVTKDWIIRNYYKNYNRFFRKKKIRFNWKAEIAFSTENQKKKYLEKNGIQLTEHKKINNLDFP